MIFIRTNCDQKSSFSGILKEPLNPREITVRTPELTRVRSIRFHLFEIKRVLVYIIQHSLNLQICLYYTLHSKCRCRQKSILEKRLKNVEEGVKL